MSVNRRATAGLLCHHGHPHQRSDKPRPLAHLQERVWDLQSTQPSQHICDLGGSADVPQWHLPRHQDHIWPAPAATCKQRASQGIAYRVCTVIFMMSQYLTSGVRAEAHLGSQPPQHGGRQEPSPWQTSTPALHAASVWRCPGVSELHNAHRSAQVCTVCTYV